MTAKASHNRHGPVKGAFQCKVFGQCAERKLGKGIPACRCSVQSVSRPGAKLTAAGLSEALSELDKFLVVDDYGSVECVKFAREEYNKRCCMGLGGGTIHMIVMVLFYLGIYI